MYDYQDPLGDTPYKILKSPIYIDAKVQGIFYTDYKAGDKVIKEFAWEILLTHLVQHSKKL